MNKGIVWNTLYTIQKRRILLDQYLLHFLFSYFQSNIQHGISHYNFLDAFMTYSWSSPLIYCPMEFFLLAFSPWVHARSSSSLFFSAQRPFWTPNLLWGSSIQIRVDLTFLQQGSQLLASPQGPLSPPTAVLAFRYQVGPSYPLLPHMFCHPEPCPFLACSTQICTGRSCCLPSTSPFSLVFIALGCPTPINSGTHFIVVLSTAACAAQIPCFWDFWSGSAIFGIGSPSNHLPWSLPCPVPRLHWPFPSIIHCGTCFGPSYSLRHLCPQFLTRSAGFLLQSIGLGFLLRTDLIGLIFILVTQDKG